MRPDASTEEIRAAYRALARRLHPDASGRTSGEMAALNEAWSVLRDPGRRAVYDAALRATVPPRPAEPAEPQEVDGDDAADFEPVGRLHPGRWGIPVLWLAVLGALALIFVFTAYAARSGSDGPAPVDGLLRPGSCVDVVAGGFAVEVPCDGPHVGRVELLPPFEAPCPAGTEAFADRNAMGKVCVKRT